MDDLSQFAEPDCVISLAANKADIEGYEEGGEKRREIEEVARRFGVPLYFTSALTGENVEKLFMDLVTRAIERQDTGLGAAKAAAGKNDEEPGVIRLDEGGSGTEEAGEGGGCC